MFAVSLDRLFVLYMGVLFIALFVFWAVSKVGEIRFRYRPRTEDLYRCPICLYLYVGSGEEDVSRCPRCKSYSGAKDAKVH